MTKVEVLDHGYVRLVDRMGDLRRVCDAARVSHDNDGQYDKSKDRKLVNYLQDHRHTSPFEHVIFTFEVKAPIFVFRQWHRHRTWSFNEMSGRYVEMEEEFYIPSPDKIGAQCATNHQARELGGINTDSSYQMGIIRGSSYAAFHNYQTLISRGCPREVARMILPLNTYSRMYATVDLHNLIHFVRLREAPDAQWEIQEYARAIKELVPEVGELL